ncbi:hypothetical protein ACEWY4_005970 [Coilia grayii]|uniref:DDE Tnp4 domain-containing protein n=1 Tax=Coilia grayii TaxID=363190 RepID=A0ABD1KCB4_9TELE
MIDMLLDKKRKRKFWVHPLLERRRPQGEFHQLIQELKLYHDRFRQYFRMSVAEFEALLAVLGPHLRRQHTNYREPIGPEQRLAISQYWGLIHHHCLLALVDHNYSFIAVDVGAYGSNSDGGIFANSNLLKSLDAGTLHVPQSLDAGTLHVPPPAPLPDAPELGSLPYTVVADDAFPLKTYVMKPYPGRHLSEERLIFNFQLSSARRMVENAFGILTQRWRVYQRRMQLAPDTVDKVIKATCVLCNYLRKETAEDGRHRNVEADEDENEDEEAVDRFLPNIPPLRGHRRPLQAMQNRDTLCRYFTSPAGQVNWQLDRVRRGIL